MRVDMPMIDRCKSLLTKLMLVLLCIAVSFMIYNQTVRTPHIDASTENGSLAVDFTLSDLQGHSHALTDYAGRGVVVNFGRHIVLLVKKRCLLSKVPIRIINNKV